MVTGVTFVGFFFRDGRQQKDGSLEIGRARTVRQRNFFVIVGPIGRRGNAAFVRQLQGFDATDNLDH